MKNWKKMIVTAAAFGALALFAGCTSASAVSLEEARELVKAQVGADAVVLEQETDREDGVYELQIILDGRAYEFEVDSHTGQVRTVEQEEDLTVQAPSVPQSITLEEAKAIAYAHAGVPESEAVDRSYERDDGIFEIGFDHGGYEYDYDIAADGTILKSEKEPERMAAPAEPKPTEAKATEPAPTEPAPAQPKPTEPKAAEPKSQRISGQEALAIALSHAGVSDARDKEAEWDDGGWEVSFDVGRTEYEYHIRADGSILRWEKEHDD